MQRYAAINFAKIADLKNYEILGREGETPEAGALQPLAPVNLFVGPNNSGKSRFLRGLLKAESYVFRPSGFELDEIADMAAPLEALLKKIFGFYGVQGDFQTRLVSEVFPSIRTLRWLETGSELSQFAGMLDRQELRNSFSMVANRTGYGSYRYFLDEASEYKRRISEREAEQATDEFDKKVEEALTRFKSGRYELQVGNEPRVYIPVLRGLRPLSKPGRRAGNDVYAEATRRDYGIDAQKGPWVFTGLGLYDALTEMLLGSSRQREHVAAYEKFLSKEFFEDRPIELVPRRNTGTVYVRIGSDEDLPIYNLGDGIQALIIFTFPVFAVDKRTLFFFEEPEVHLHPGMQRRLMELLVRHEQFKRHQFFITTHSNHLLDMAADYSACSTFMFRRTGDEHRFQIRALAGPDKSVLHELGARSSSVFLTNASIWVEGITDRLYLREFMRRYLSELGQENLLKEDTHYSFIEFGGANIVHWDFQEPSPTLPEKIRVASICSQSIVLLDGDNREKGSRIDDLRGALGERLIVLNSKEVENLLPESVVRHIVADRLPAQSTAESLSRVRLDDYHQRPLGLGAYLDEALSVEVFSGSGTGTVKDKVKFCELAVQFMQEQEGWTLPVETHQLCERLVRFICEANGIRPPSAP